jgi:hypothetical protein
MNKTKYAVHYRLPTQCCNNCQHSYMNSYGDCQCVVIEPGAIITEGAVCDDWASANRASVPREKTVPIAEAWDKPVSTDTCTTCKYSYSDNGTPKCMCTLKVIEPTGTCKKWEAEEVVIEKGDCNDCKYSQYKDEQPFCNFYNIVIGDVTQGCYDWAREE